MDISKVEKCCFCISNRLGALILGWIQTIIFSFLSIFSNLLWINSKKILGDEGDDEHPSIPFLIIYFIFCQVGLYSSIALLVGVYRSIPKLIFQWVVIALIGLMILVVKSILSLGKIVDKHGWSVLFLFVFLKVLILGKIFSLFFINFRGYLNFLVFVKVLASFGF